MRWIMSWRADPVARLIADQHYNRQRIGARQFVPPGRCLVLRTLAGDALWITSWPFPEYVKHDWPGAWVCSAFRNNNPKNDANPNGNLSCELAAEAIAATRYHFGHAPEHGMVTFVDPTKTRRKRDPGRCFLRVGFEEVGGTRGGLVALQLFPARIVYLPPMKPLSAQLELMASARLTIAGGGR